MGGILVLAEHRKGNLLDVTWEMLNKGAYLAGASGMELSVLLPGYNIEAVSGKLAQSADQVLVIDDKRLENYNYEVYRDLLADIFREQRPELIIIGHTTLGMDLAPGLAAYLDIPLTTACIDFSLQNGSLSAVRQMYDGKVNAEVSCTGNTGYMVTVRPGSFPVEGQQSFNGRVNNITVPIKEPLKSKFIENIEAITGSVDITQADILVSVGQGIGDKKNIPIVEELATLLGGSLSCSRPVVDKKWLTKEHQVGSSGKTVKPKIYIAIGISGSFQHLMGLKGGTIIAINKDPKAPIFRVADYGIVGDLFQVIPVLKEKIKALK